MFEFFKLILSILLLFLCFWNFLLNDAINDDFDGYNLVLSTGIAITLFILVRTLIE